MEMTIFPLLLEMCHGGAKWNIDFDCWTISVQVLQGRCGTVTPLDSTNTIYIGLMGKLFLCETSVEVVFNDIDRRD